LTRCLGQKNGLSLLQVGRNGRVGQ